ncbi:MAG: SusC/RagA family TonB-linked outer membrane protein [Chitinophagaceae bacterium]|nr:SusC/RagA family TonB-linked outer membrane protein [Chitinophagaceae bacterium]
MRFLLTAICLFVTNILLAQQKTITGKITDASGQPVVGATVSAKGGAATQTDFDGKFSIAVASKIEKLTVSSVGYETQEVSIAGRNVIAVSLVLSSAELSEVVVTALGIERNKKSLQFSATQVGGENFTQARENSTVNGLAGRVAGVNVSKIATGPGASTRVIIRGAKSLGANLNQPLYVVDGVPMDNTNFGQAGLWGGADQGDGMSSINPDDIASMTVLKGAGAAALYGSRAANGVILITTKKGSGHKGLGIEFNSNYVFETVQNLTDFQQTHGNGGYVGDNLTTSVAKKPETFAEHWDNQWGLQAWGPKFDGTPVVQFDSISRPYSYAGDNWKRFYNTGHSITNSIALSGGSETQSYRFSAAHLKSDGVIPNSGFDRINLSLAANSKLSKKLTFSSKVLYSNEQTKNRPNVSDAPGNLINAMYYIPGDVDVRNMIGDPNKPGAVPSLEAQQEKGIKIGDKKSPGEEFQVSKNLWQQNPYWAAYQYINSDTRDRVITTGNLRYDITDFLYVSGQAGMDWFTKKGTGLTPQGTGYSRGGSMTEYEVRQREINYQYTIGFDKTFGKIGVNAFFGGNRMRSQYERIDANGSGFNTPFFAAITNAKDKTYGYGYAKSGINSLFGSVELSYNNYLFLTGTARKDWFSVLNPVNNSILYPSIGASFVFTDAFKSLPSWLSYGKLRAGWAQVGNVNSVGAYQTLITYAAPLTHVGAPIGGFTSGNNYPNTELVPFLSSEYEGGIEARFFNNRLGLDFTYYDQTTTKDILNATISRGSGFTTTTVNLGKLTNKGVELLLTGTPVRRKNLSWDVSLNFAKNKSKIISLIDDQKEILGEEPRTRTVFIKHIVGQPYGMITGQVQLHDPKSGLPVFDKDGAPVTDGSYQILGNGVPDFTGGLNNSFTFKGFNVSFLIDFKSGGDIYSGTNVRMTQAGYTKQTLLGREGEAPLTVTGVISDGSGGYTPFTKTLTPGEAQNYWGKLGDKAAEKFLYDASFIKLRQITVGYVLPAGILSKTPIRSIMVSLVARNLAILYKKTDNIDPESSYTSGNSQGLDYFGMPATRTFGINLRATF